jgi:hypothetical protein
MSRRSRKYRKRFKCGHRGFGRFCHCCADRERIRKLRKDEQQRPHQKTEKDTIGLHKLPKAIAHKAHEILEKITHGTEYWRLGGKRLIGERSLIRVPVGYRYRILCREEGDRVVPLKVVSHEAYNSLVRGGLSILSRLLSSGSGDR